MPTPTKTVYEHLAANVRSARIRKGWSIDALAYHAGVKVETIRAVERGGKRLPRHETVQSIAAALDCSSDSLFGDSASGGACLDSVIERFMKLAKDTLSGDVSLQLDVPSYLNSLRHELSLLRDEAGDTAAVAGVIGQIKHLCIMAEDYFTGQAIEAGGKLPFLYSCSSLIDHGISAYVRDSAWMRLLDAIGTMRRESGSSFLRVFFLDSRNTSTAQDALDLFEIVRRHLGNGISVAFVDVASAPLELLYKKNMAWIGGRKLLHTTDQIKWELELTNSAYDISEARDKHAELVRISKVIFTPEEIFAVAYVKASIFSLLGVKPDGAI